MPAISERPLWLCQYKSELELQAFIGEYSGNGTRCNLCFFGPKNQELKITLLGSYIGDTFTVKTDEAGNALIPASKLKLFLSAHHFGLVHVTYPDQRTYEIHPMELIQKVQMGREKKINLHTYFPNQDFPALPFISALQNDALINAGEDLSVVEPGEETRADIQERCEFRRRKNLAVYQVLTELEPLLHKQRSENQQSDLIALLDDLNQQSQLLEIAIREYPSVFSNLERFQSLRVLTNKIENAENILRITVDRLLATGDALNKEENRFLLAKVIRLRSLLLKSEPKNILAISKT